MTVELPRRLGLGGALLLSFNGAIGAALFALPATLALQLGDFSPWLFPLAGLVCLLIALPYASASAAFPVNGGPVAAGADFGRFAGFQLGWLYYISRAAAFAANLNVLVDYGARWAGLDLPPFLRALAMVVVVAALALANIASVRGAVRLLAGLTVLKTLPVLLVTGLLFGTLPLPATPSPPELNAVEASLLLAFYAFIGFENSVVTAGETRQAERNVPRALIGTILVVAALYFLVQLAFVAADPAIAPGEEKAPLLALGRQALGGLGATLITLAAVASLLGNLHSNLAATPRVTHALAVRGDLPAWFGRLSASATPAASIAFMAAFVAALAVSGGFVWLAVISTLSRMIVYAATIAAGQKARGSDLLQRGLGIAGILLCALIATQADRLAWLTLLALAAGGALLFVLATRAQQRLQRG